MKTYDVVIVGGGPGGLSAALLLGRGRASVLLVDGGTPRNANAHRVHTFVTRDGTPPAEFRAIAREQLAPYSTVEVRSAIVSQVEALTAHEPDGSAFVVAMGDTRVRARKVLLAVGMVDQLPALPGLAEQWGTSVFQCPYCHGFELRDRPWGVYVNSEMMAGFAPFLKNWSSQVTAFTNGQPLSDEAIATLRQHSIALESEPIAQLVGSDALSAVLLKSGRSVVCSALVMRPPQRQVALVLALRLSLDEQGLVRVDPRTKESSISGIHVVGDATTLQQGALTAAADGLTAAAMMNHSLVLDRLARGRSDDPLTRGACENGR